MANQLALTIHLTLLFIQAFFLAAPCFPGKAHLLVLCILILTTATHLVGPVSTYAAETQPYTLLWPIWLATVEKCVTASSTPIEDHYWRVDRPSREASDMTSFGPRKLKWACASLCNWRLIRWNRQTKNVPTSTNLRRSNFLIAQLFKFPKLLLMSDLILQLNIRLFWTAPDGSAFTDSKRLTIQDPSWLWSFGKALAFGCGPYFFMNMQYVALSIPTVLVGLGKPVDWPPLFGNIKDATTVRAFWGQFWHQSIRIPLTTIGDCIIDALGIQRKTILGDYVFIWIAFGISGIMHAQSMALLPRPANISVLDTTVGIMYFFLWQALAITLEDFAQWVWHVENHGRAESLIGYVWVVCNMWFSLPWAADVMMRLRLTEESFLGFTFFGPWVHRMPLP
ncbi:toxin biosynthesis protein [Lophiotrema nucula]|uniref:Toxin biosynthesis protein n=1 Tax=Lophiotrema nucula TaxID=690887 RepID=A0A6A5ZUU7_9PLEO|nr:toxin biosynthesis protein [Lophiotrema nucula]